MRSWWDLGEGSGNLGEDLSLYMIECAFCGEKGNFSLDHRSEKKKPNSSKVIKFDTYKCGSCAGYTMVLWSSSEHGFGNGLHSFRVLPYPLKISGAPDYLPASVGRSWLQTQKAIESESWDAAAVMARTAMQTALKDNNAKGDRLVDQIDDLSEKGILPPLMKDWAHEVRLLGNEGTHAEPDSDGVSSNDVRDASEFLDYLLEYLYRLPKVINEYRERRLQTENQEVEE